MNPKVGIINYGMGNIQSVRNSFEFLGADVFFIQKPSEMSESSHIVLPGVGSFAEGMSNLRKLGFVEAIQKTVLQDKKPFLGICLGMQLLAAKGTEGGDVEGLNLIPGTVKRFEMKDLRVPHVGWNNIRTVKPNPLITQSMDVDYYFVHSYFFDAPTSDVISTCDYGNAFPCVVGRNHFFGVQFHPEKSHAYGLKILKNFMGLAC